MPLRKLFFDNAFKYAENLALFANGESFTYRSFFENAFSCAEALKANGFEGNSPCALFGMRSRHTYDGLMGTILAGGFYVPTNPSFPAERNLKILARSGAKYVFFDTRYHDVYKEALEKSSGIIFIIEKETKAEEFQKLYPQHKFYSAGDYEPKIFEPSRDDKDKVYLLFTSGSTGEPKGVAINGYNLINYIEATAKRMEIPADSRFIQLFDLTFDLSAHTLFLAMANGASIFVTDDKSMLNPSSFVRDYNITHWASVPTAAALLDKLRLLQPNSFPHIKYSMFCGEALPYDLALKWSLAAPDSVIENLYGPTEATIACAYHKFDKEISKKYSVNGLTPIGEAFYKTSVLAVDENLKPVKKGETGELLLGGVQLAEGYFNDEAKTIEKFIYIDGERFYKTGDLVQENECGMVFIGRADTQIKIRGYRIELSEIENEASKFTGSPISVALPISSGGVSYSGIALFVLNNGGWTKEGLVERLQKILPPYMTPSRIEVLEEFPRNASGKVDRNKLKELL